MRRCHHLSKFGVVFFVYTKVFALRERAKDELYEFKLEQSGGMQMRTISLFYTFAK